MRSASKLNTISCPSHVPESARTALGAATRKSTGLPFTNRAGASATPQLSDDFIGEDDCAEADRASTTAIGSSKKDTARMTKNKSL
ncbi:MAG: hypothetical protein ABSD53_04780 [Terriglobales bacterium]